MLCLIIHHIISEEYFLYIAYTKKSALNTSTTQNLWHTGSWLDTSGSFDVAIKLDKLFLQRKKLNVIPMKATKVCVC